MTDGNLNTKFAQLLRRSTRRSRIPQLRNFALTPLDIAVRLDIARLDIARLDGKTGHRKTGRQDWTARLDIARLDRKTGIDGEYEDNILRQYILYSLRRLSLTAERSGLFFMLSSVSARLCRCGMPALPE